jgi:hypothetical protein
MSAITIISTPEQLEPVPRWPQSTPDAISKRYGARRRARTPKEGNGLPGRQDSPTGLVACLAAYRRKCTAFRGLGGLR